MPILRIMRNNVGSLVNLHQLGAAKEGMKIAELEGPCSHEVIVPDGCSAKADAPCTRSGSDVFDGKYESLAYKKGSRYSFSAHDRSTKLVHFWNVERQRWRLAWFLL